MLLTQCFTSINEVPHPAHYQKVAQQREHWTQGQEMPSANIRDKAISPVRPHKCCIVFSGLDYHTRLLTSLPDSILCPGIIFLKRSSNRTASLLTRRPWASSTCGHRAPSQHNCQEPFVIRPQATLQSLPTTQVPCILATWKGLVSQQLTWFFLPSSLA